jgi:hypothetical protein
VVVILLACVLVVDGGMASLLDFMEPDDDAPAWGTPVEIETRRRIRLSLWAYAYEYKDDPLVSDEIFDKESLLVNLNISTTNAKMDKWFKKNFSPSTGFWIREHPDIEGLERIYNLLRNKNG